MRRLPVLVLVVAIPSSISRVVWNHAPVASERGWGNTLDLAPTTPPATPAATPAESSKEEAAREAEEIVAMPEIKDGIKRSILTREICSENEIIPSTMDLSEYRVEKLCANALAIRIVFRIVYVIVYVIHTIMI